MQFAFTDEQRQFAAVVDDVLSTLSTPTAVRDAWSAPPGDLDRAAWEQLTELGLAAALLPESEDGLELDERDVTLVFERLGYHATPGPLVESILVAPALDRRRPELVATNLGGELVPCAADADALLLADAARSRVVRFGRKDIHVEHTASVDGARRLGRVAPSSPGELVSDDPGRIRDAFERGVFGTSAMLIGLAQRMLDMTVEYVTERHQFGVPIGSFQAVKHHCADAATAIAFARPAVHRAGWSLATGAPDRTRDVSMAKVVASDAAQRVGHIALQCHGAIAYTVEYDLHLYLKRAEALVAAWGGRASHRAQVAVAIGA